MMFSAATCCRQLVGTIRGKAVHRRFTTPTREGVCGSPGMMLGSSIEDMSAARDTREPTNQGVGDDDLNVSLVWQGDPAPGRSALDEKPETSSKPASIRLLLAQDACPITLPRSAGEFFSAAKLREDVETEPASD